MSFDAEKIENAFDAPVFHRVETNSTMDDARVLAGEGLPSGTVIYADYQSAGRGRVAGRSWEAGRGESLLCTVLLRMAPPPALALRVGLAVARTFDHFLAVSGCDNMTPAHALNRSTRIKWPNDVLIDGKKIAGILCESDGGGAASGPLLYVGTGLNIGQRNFPPGLARKATSLALAMTGLRDTDAEPPAIGTVLSVYLDNLRAALADDRWQEAVTDKLLWRGERISFLAGDPNRRETVEGVIEGIGPSGELLFKRQGGETERLWSGEIPYPGDFS